MITKYTTDQEEVLDLLGKELDKEFLANQAQVDEMQNMLEHGTIQPEDF